MKVKDIMTENPLFVHPETPINAIENIFNRTKFWSVYVGEQNDFVGIITRDDLRYRRSSYSLSTPACKIMTKGVISIDENADVEDAQRILSAKRINGIAVTRNGKHVGIVTQSDITTKKNRRVTDVTKTNVSSVTPPASPSSPLDKTPTLYSKMMEDGISLLSNKKPSEAIVIFNKILAEHPNDVEAFRWRSLTKERLSSNYLEEDNLILPLIIIPTPYQTPTRYSKMVDDGVSLLSNKKPSEAIAIFNKILVEHPNDVEAFRWRSLAEERLSYNGSEENFQKVPIQHTIQNNYIPHSPTVKSLPTNRKPTELVCILIRNHGISIIENPISFNGLLKDYYKGEFKKEVRILLTSVEEKIPQDIIAKKNQIPFTILSGQLIQRLDDCGFSKELAQWAVYTWAEVIGVDI